MKKTLLIPIMFCATTLFAQEQNTELHKHQQEISVLKQKLNNQQSVINQQKTELANLSSKTKLSKGAACDVLAIVGLCANDYLNREVNASLSGGELKRIEIASVIMRGSKLTIFDEPEAGIDLWSFNNLIKVFHEMQNTLSGSIVVISHQERILKIADEIILLSEGRIDKVVPRGEPLESFIDMEDVTASCRKL